MSLIYAMNGNFTLASFFIIYAMLFDGFDGIVARLLNSSSEFGVELDSLSDMVSFGVAPSFIIYNLYFKNIETFGVVISSLFMVFSALRLARFNVQLVGFDKDYFKGLPTPIAAVTLCSFVIFYNNKIFSEEVSIYFIWLLAFLLPALMISNFKYDTLPKINKQNIKKYPVKFIIILIAAILIIITKGEGIFSFCLFYISSGIIRSFFNFISPKKKRLSKTAADKQNESVDPELNLK